MLRDGIEAQYVPARRRRAGAPTSGPAAARSERRRASYAVGHRRGQRLARRPVAVGRLDDPHLAAPWKAAALTPRRARSASTGSGSARRGQAGGTSAGGAAGHGHAPPGRRRRRPRRRARPWRRRRATWRAPPRSPRTSTRTPPGPPSGWGRRSIGRRAVTRSRRLAARRAVTRSTPGRAGTSSSGVGQRGPVAVAAADRVGEPAQLPARARPGGGPSRRRASRGRARRGRVVLAGAGRAAGAGAGDVHLVDLVEQARSVAGEQAREPGREGGADDDGDGLARWPRRRGRAGRRTSSTSSDVDTTATPAAQAAAACGDVVAGRRGEDGDVDVAPTVASASLARPRPSPRACDHGVGPARRRRRGASTCDAVGARQLAGGPGPDGPGPDDEDGRRTTGGRGR